jgi:hypothetical protein
MPLSYVAANVTVLIAVGGIAALLDPSLRAWFWSVSRALCRAVRVARLATQRRRRTRLVDLVRAPFCVLWSSR